MPDLAGVKTAYYGFTGLITSDNATRIAAAMNAAANNQFDCVHLCFSSGGGYVADGIYLYNHIRGLPRDIVMHNVGTVASIAAAIFVAANKRYCSSHSVFMIHPTTINSSGDLAAERLQTALTCALADDQRTENILRERTAIPDHILAARRYSDVWIQPAEALSFGLVDEVREFSLPKGEQLIQI